LYVPTKTALFTVENTDPKCGWVTSYFETAILRGIWYPSTVATISRMCENIIREFYEKYSDDPSAMTFALHDFGYRGVSSDESGQIGGLAHLINGFRGTDTMGAFIAAMEYYNHTDVDVFSVIASEHTTMSANSNADTLDDYDAFEKMVSILESRVKESGTFQIVSAVIDTYDDDRAASEYIGGIFRQRIMDSGGRFVARPDSGDPITNPVRIVEIFLDKFGYAVNSKGMKVLPPCIRVLQGDGITFDTIRSILELAASRDIAPDNFVFGMGAGLLQKCDRDTFKFAMKSSAICVNGEWRDVFKSPKNDPGKKSLRGRVTTVRTIGDEVITKRIEDVLHTDVDIMQTVYENGKLLVDHTLEEVRANARIFK
jgi:nicotinamide phosphoribosyltransferase